MSRASSHSPGGSAGGHRTRHRIGSDVDHLESCLHCDGRNRQARHLEVMARGTLDGEWSSCPSRHSPRARPDASFPTVSTWARGQRFGRAPHHPNASPAGTQHQRTAQESSAGHRRQPGEALAPMRAARRPHRRPRHRPVYPVPLPARRRARLASVSGLQEIEACTVHSPPLT